MKDEAMPEAPRMSPEKRRRVAADRPIREPPNRPVTGEKAFIFFWKRVVCGKLLKEDGKWPWWVRQGLTLLFGFSSFDFDGENEAVSKFVRRFDFLDSFDSKNRSKEALGKKSNQI